MSMINILQSFNSIASSWARAALQSFLQQPVSPSTVTQDVTAPTEIVDYRKYNQSLMYLYQGLHQSYMKLQELEAKEEKNTRNTQATIDSVVAAVNDLEGRIGFILDSLPYREVYTDTLYETFSSHAKVEPSIIFYGGGIKPKAYINSAEQLLSLPPLSEAIHSKSYLPNAAPSCTIDRLLGISVSEGETLDDALDGDPNTFWKETIISKIPIFANRLTQTWLPSGYSGGAACRLRVDLMGMCSISEVTIKPLGEFPTNLIGIGFVDSTPSLLDCSFGSYGTSGSLWTSGSVSYGVSGTGTLTVADNIALLATTSSSGSCWLQSSINPTGPVYSLEVEFDAKSQGRTPIEITLYSYDSTSGSLGESTQVIFTEGDGWTAVKMAFDVPSGTAGYSIRWTNPPNFERPANLWITNPSINSIVVLERSDSFTDTFTASLSYPILTSTIFLIMAQEHGDLKGYAPIMASQLGIRSLKKTTRPPQLMSWEYYRSLHNIPRSLQPQTLPQTPKIMSELSPTLVNGITSPPTSGGGELFYTYVIGAHNIDIKSVEYSSGARYVSPSIKLAGEIREIRLAATENYNTTSDISYTVTLNENDPPEFGKAIQNSTRPSNSTGTGSSQKIQTIGTWGSSSVTFAQVTTPGVFNSSDPYLQDYLSRMTWFAMTPYVSATNTVGLSFASTLNLDSDDSAYMEFYLTAAANDLAATGELMARFTVDLINADDEVALTGNIEAIAAPLSFTNEHYGFRTLQLIPIAGVDRSAISHFRITYTGGQQSGHSAYLVIRNARTTGSSSTTRVVRFLPLDEVESLSPGDGDFVVPPKSRVEVIKGTDRNGRAALKEYPYINRERVNSLSQAMSLGTGGRQVAYDPNILSIRALTSGGAHTTLTGYRPIAVTLYFPDSNLSVGADYLGKPKIGDIATNSEILEVAALSQKTISVTREVEDTSQEWFQNRINNTGWGNRTTTTNNNNNWGNTGQSNTDNTKKMKTVVTEMAVLYYQTAYKPIYSDSTGIAALVWWTKSSSPATLQAISSVNLQIDPANGIINILEPPPTGFDQVYCSYSYVRGESSLREYYTFRGITGDTTTTQTSLQKYPVTRNMTDYMNGIIPKLKPPNLDATSPDYYPIFEYYQHPAGYLVFSINMHTYSDTPAEITVEYSTLGISPRVIIDLQNMNSDVNPTYTPRVADYTLLLNVRR